MSAWGCRCGKSHLFAEKLLSLPFKNYNSEMMNIEWEDGFTIKVRVDDDNTVVISANKEGLLSLARQMTALADEAAGVHLHYDEYNSLEEGSTGMIVEKIDG